jgi:hypothetical protein
MSDTVRVGNALNALQIAEHLIRKRPYLMTFGS